MKRIFWLPVLLLIIFSSCRGVLGKRVRGDGNVKTESRSAGQFDNIDVSGAINVYLKQDSSHSVSVEADENLLSYVEIYDEGNTLIIRPRDGFNLNPSKDIKVYVASPGFNKIEASGACDVYTQNKILSSGTIEIGLSGSCDAKMELNAPKVDADLSGAGTLQLKGETKDFKVQGSGSTDIKCIELMTENADIDISGAGDAEIYASEKLNVDVSGAASVKYKGNASVSQKISGAGSVKKID
jgi:hypothetical protein